MSIAIDQEKAMPELPEVETTLRGIKPHILHEKVTKVTVRCKTLRWPIPAKLDQLLCEQTLNKLERRGKYLLFFFSKGTLLLHLGMSGRLNVLAKAIAPKKHDHVDIHFANTNYIRFTDPRRFGALLWTVEDPYRHSLLGTMGKEPLTKNFNGNYLWQCARKRKVVVKSFIMNSKIVAGVGNIYATEALFKAKICPTLSAHKISRERYEDLASAIKNVLKNAIQKGGTTLKDFLNPSGSAGYFQLELAVYGKGNQACPRCHTKLKTIKIGQRGTVYCSSCQR